ncbi:hypothetical protein M422DRAFT_55375 [Sphaerobolus stellatus SS14]|uniref:Uncharacterized protein n=1 Tax=Sphaerobolus stellatus (strain SS14) TaxID=990650 RepID=A0A0C9UMP7_SPHS4|nr:hypothetical protein M422DRAFT_55375 [Sphaerobolus stellatus SS14]
MYLLNILKRALKNKSDGAADEDYDDDALSRDGNDGKLCGDMRNALQILRGPLLPLFQQPKNERSLFGARNQNPRWFLTCLATRSSTVLPVHHLFEVVPGLQFTFSEPGTKTPDGFSVLKQVRLFPFTICESLLHHANSQVHSLLLLLIQLFLHKLSLDAIILFFSDK